MSLGHLKYLFCLIFSLNCLAQDANDPKPTTQPSSQINKESNSDKDNPDKDNPDNTISQRGNRSAAKVDSLPNSSNIVSQLDSLALDSLGLDSLGLDSLSMDSLLLDSLQKNFRNLPDLEIASDGLDEKVEYSARDSIIYDIVAEKIYLYGAGSISQGKISLSADYIEYNYSDKTVFATGSLDSLGEKQGRPYFKDGGDEFGADEMTYNLETEKGKLSELITKEGDGFIRSEQVRKNEYDELFGERTFYTSCNHEHPHFRIEAKKVKIIPDEVIVTGPAKLIINEIPTPLVLPFGIFPLTEERRSGIILPTYGRSPGQGFYLRSGGFYFALSDYIDLAVRGDLYSRGTWALNLASKYRKRYKYSGGFRIDFGKRVNGDQITKEFASTRDFKISWNHNQAAQANPNSSFSASVNLGTSTYNRNFVTTTNDYLTNTLASSINYSNSLPGTPFNMSFGFTHSQNTRNEQVTVSFPDLSLNMKRIYPLKRKEQVGDTKWYEKIGMTYRGNLKNTVTVADSLFFSNEMLKNMRNGFKHDIPISTSFNLGKYINVSPSISYTELWYSEAVNKSWDGSDYFDTTFTTIYDTLDVENEVLIVSSKVPSQIDTIPGQVIETIDNGFKTTRKFSGSISANTRLYGMYNLKKGWLRALRHVMSPSLSYSWKPDFGEDRYGIYKDVATDRDGTLDEYSIYEGSIFGSPSIGKTSSLNLSIDNNLEMKVKSKKDTSSNLKKIKILESFKISGSYNFAADSLKLSTIRMTARTTILNKIKIDFSTTFNPYAVNDLGRTIDKFEWTENRGLARMTNMRLNINTSLKSKKKSSNKTSRGNANEKEDVLNNLDSFIDFKIPWKLSLQYVFNLNRTYSGGEVTPNLTQTLNTTLDFNLTPKWKINIRTGYDFVNKNISYTRVDLFRDLHCWNMAFNWVPSGDRKRYEFVIRANSALLQDLKLQRKRDWYDF